MHKLFSKIGARIPIILVVCIVLAVAAVLLSGVQQASKTPTMTQLKVRNSGVPNASTQIGPQAPNPGTTAKSGGVTGTGSAPSGSAQSQPSTSQSVIQPTVPVQSVGKCTGCPTGNDPGDSATACPNASCPAPALPQCPPCGGYRKVMTNDAMACPMVMCAQ